MPKKKPTPKALPKPGYSPRPMTLYAKSGSPITITTLAGKDGAGLTVIQAMADSVSPSPSPRSSPGPIMIVTAPNLDPRTQ